MDYGKVLNYVTYKKYQYYRINGKLCYNYIIKISRG
jgi:hypothetical protein